ncbi:hypothetical protein [uncultured Chitinophaga sp.]|uniref:hypothetical protein n=1 Tax=uncultured Chitinophaga sp. TaxID=339340 RepID=UPI002610BA47|nr:hypothetical protein [uncultured Chitinophaga sp.]
MIKLNDISSNVVNQKSKSQNPNPKIQIPNGGVGLHEDSLEFGICPSVSGFGPKPLLFGIWYLEFDPWSLEFGYFCSPLWQQEKK